MSRGKDFRQKKEGNFQSSGILPSPFKPIDSKSSSLPYPVHNYNWFLEKPGARPDVWEINFHCGCIKNQRTFHDEENSTIICPLNNGVLDLQLLVENMESQIFNKEKTLKRKKHIVYFDEYYEKNGLFDKLMDLFQTKHNLQLITTRHPDRIKKKWTLKNSEYEIKFKLLKSSRKIFFSYPHTREKNFFEIFGYFIFFCLVLFGAYLIWTGNSEGNFLSWNSMETEWPLPDDRISSLRQTLEPILYPEQEVALTKIVQALQHHDGRKPLVLHFVGNSKSYSDIVIQKLSKILYGSEFNDRVTMLGDVATISPLSIQEKIYQQSKKWPNSLFVLYTSPKTRAFEGLDFLASVFDDNYPSILFNEYDSISTRSIIFIIISDIMDSEEVKSVVNPDLLDLIVKQKLKRRNWPERVSQRITYTIPFL